MVEKAGSGAIPMRTPSRERRRHKRWSDLRPIHAQCTISALVALSDKMLAIYGRLIRNDRHIIGALHV